MSLFVLGYPTITESDFHWIQSFRSDHDERYFKVVDPHFTIVFPVSTIERNTFINHVKEGVSNFTNIDFTLRCSLVVKDSFSDFTDIFLVPDEGFSRIVKLHDTLYTGILAVELRLDIPFIPHMGIGSAIDPAACKLLADQLNAQSFCISGRLEKIDIVNYENRKVETIAQFVL
jgi:hypothetical protein